MPLEEGLAICLYRLSTSDHLSDMAQLFGRSQCALSEISNAMIKIFYNLLKPLVAFHEEFCRMQKMQEWEAAIRSKRCFLTQYIGFINRTFRERCYPSHDQNIIYTGEIQAPSIKHQGFVTPDGLIWVLLGPLPGNMQDVTVISTSQLLEKLLIRQKKLESGSYFCVCGDSGYLPATFRPFPKERHDGRAKSIQPCHVILPNRHRLAG